MMENVIETSELTKVFSGNITAVDKLNLSVERGAVYGLIGRNGAGKTTALRLIMGLLNATSGTATVLGKQLRDASRADRARVAYVSQNQNLPTGMTPAQLYYYASHFYETWDHAYGMALAKRLNIATDRKVGAMSGGEQRKVAIFLALSARPEVLILDEPAAGLDPIARRELIDELVEVISTVENCTIVLSTHIISDLERLADHIGIMHTGKLVNHSRLDELQSKVKRAQIIFEGNSPPNDFKLSGALRSKVEGPVLSAIIKIENERELQELVQLPNAKVNLFPIGLEDMFIELFGSFENGEEAEVRK